MPALNPARVYLESLAPGKSQQTVAGLLNGLARLAAKDSDARWQSYPWHRLRYAQTQAIRRRLGELFTPAGANLRLSILRRVLEEAFALELMQGDDYQRARRIKNFRGRPKPRGRALDQEELRQLVQTCRSAGGPKGARDAAIFATAYATGARRAELVGIRWPTDLDLERGTLELRCKGQKHRQADVQPPIRQALEAWLTKRGRGPGALFQPVDRYGNVKRRALTPGAILQLCAARGRQAGLRPFSPHDLRRTFASELLDSGVDLHVVSEMLDHEQLTTTARYDPRAGSRKKAAATRLRIPF